MLYLVSTPIGNLKDITLRALELLASCDYILCEDTRHSLVLLRHYSIQKPLKSYHKFNEATESSHILEDLKAGKEICLISDAGSPGISDPGSLLVQLCIGEGITVSTIPGPCALIAALSSSGLLTDHFQFVGFLPRKENELKQKLIDLLDYPGVTIAYESPQRLLQTLEKIEALAPNRSLVVGRELTKKFEEFIRGKASELLNRWKDSPPKGEIVLMIASPDQHQKEEWRDWHPQEHVRWLIENYNLSKQEALKLAAKLRGVPKRDIYQQLVNQKKESADE